MMTLTMESDFHNGRSIAEYLHVSKASERAKTATKIFKLWLRMLCETLAAIMIVVCLERRPRIAENKSTTRRTHRTSAHMLSSEAAHKFTVCLFPL